VVCPQNAKEIVSDMEKVKMLLQSSEKVVVSLAPSFIANYNGVSIKIMKNALTGLGFYDVEETAIGAQIVKTEYEEYIEKHQPESLSLQLVIRSIC